MLPIILTSTLSFISTNIDDIFMLMLFFAQCHTLRAKAKVAAGQYLGIGVLAALSLLGAVGLRLLPQPYIGLLGLLPLALGAKALLSNSSAGGKQDSDSVSPSAPGLLSVTLVTIAGGGDNIGVYIPLFAGLSPTEQICSLVVFALSTGLWCLLADRLSRLPGIQNIIHRYKHILIPTVLIGLGLYILADAYLI
jgi:cadmium resistance transport/sequestration family protein